MLRPAPRSHRSPDSAQRAAPAQRGRTTSPSAAQNARGLAAQGVHHAANIAASALPLQRAAANPCAAFTATPRRNAPRIAHHALCRQAPDYRIKGM